MCFASVDDSTGSAEITVFGDLYPEVSNLLNSDETLCIVGKLEITEKRACILVDKAMGFVKDATVDIIRDDIKLQSVQSKLSH